MLQAMMMSEGLLLLLFLNGLVPTRSASSVVFRCGNTNCTAGQDCLSVSGTPRCADPCQHYSVLNDTWRATDHDTRKTRRWHCDKGTIWKGWYRLFLGDSSVQMPEKCVQRYMCGTQAPLWLTAPHPRLADGVQQRGVCGSWDSWYDGCCQFKPPPIHVKACPGNYYVYKIVKPNGCNFAYCADVNTTLDLSKVCGICRENETCVSNDNITWTCEMRVIPELVCGRSVMQLGLLLAQLEGRGLDGTSAHLVDRRCSAPQSRNGTVWYQVERTEHTCGNVLKTNGSHAIYSNTLFVYPNVTAGANGTLVQPLSFPFSCHYSLETEASLDVAIRPVLRPSDRLSGGLSGSGPKARASMWLFRSARYSSAYPAGRVTLPLGSVLYVAVAVEEVEKKRFVVVLENCYATPTADPEDPERHFLIQRQCPSDRRQVTVSESGSSLQARFSALLFLFQGDYRHVFLHCSLSLCDQHSATCRPDCSGRRRRSVTESHLLEALTVGPITWDESLE